jgi:hypothetical protein
MKKKTLLPLLSGLMMVATFATLTGFTYADNSTKAQGGHFTGGSYMHKQSGVGGTVTAISGSTITVQGKNSTSYTVDATAAKISKITAPATPGTKPTITTITLADIQVGDTLRAQGTVSGTTVTATQITDGTFMGGWVGGKGMTGGLKGGKHIGTATAPKQPGIGGTVTAISGSTITVQGKNSTSYTVDATSSKISKITAPATAGTKPTITTITLADIQVGDTLRVQGTVSGTTVTATQITDGTFIGGGKGKGMMGKGKGEGKNEMPGVGGTVTAISGSTITVQGKNSTSYTVDATTAKISKITAPTTAGTKPTITSITVADIQVGDTLRVHGTVSGTTVTATNITDGQIAHKRK